MRKEMLIDTNLLILLTVGLTDPRLIEKHKRLYPVYTRQHYQALQKILRDATVIVSTPHILTETSNLLRQIAEPMCSRIMLVFRGLIGNLKEFQIDARTLAENRVFVRLGLTDSAIVSLPPEAIVVLTVDHDLHIAAAQAGFEVYNLTPVFHDSR